MARRLGILAGGGRLPSLLVEAGRASGLDPFVLCLEGSAEPADFARVPHALSPVAKVGRIVETLKEAGCTDLVLAGRMTRPDFKSLVPDLRGMKLLPRLLAAKGDDAILRAVIEDLESEGFRVLGVDDVLADLLAPLGAVGARTPDPQAEADMARGVAVLGALGTLDVGQAVTVQDGIVLGIEAAEGTDGLLERTRNLVKPGRGGVLVKLRKSGQERRADLPAIGTETIARVAAAGLSGIAVEAGGALIIDRKAVARAADEAGLFVVGVAAERRG